MKILVTGATGFIGLEIVKLLVARPGTEVILAARRTVELGRLAVSPHRIELVDLLVPGAARNLIERVRPTHLIHLAWDVEPGKFWSSAANLEWAAVTQSLVACFLARGGQGAAIAGTCAEYDWGEGRLTEDSPIAPGTFYGLCKDAVRRSVCAAGVLADVPVAWGRIFWLYGPREAAGRLVSDVTASLLDGRPVDTTEGYQRRDLIHVRDAAAAFVAALFAGWHGPFNIGSGHAVPVRDVIGAIAEAVGRPELVRFGTRVAPINDPPLVEADTRTLNEAIGFIPQIDLEQGLRETVAWWREQRLNQTAMRQ